MHSHILSLTDVSVAYGPILALEAINLDLHCGSCVGLIGPNGAGKTTLIRALAGLIPLQAGKISLGHHGSGKTGGSVAYLPQRTLVDWDFPVTVRGLVEMGRYARLGMWGAFTAADTGRVDAALHLVHLEALAGRQINTLSGGQQQRAFLARAWAQEAHVYLLDEPFNGLDKNAQKDLAQLLRRLAGEGALLLVSHHDLRTAPEIFDRVVLLNRRLIAVGPPAEVLQPNLVEAAYDD